MKRRLEITEEAYNDVAAAWTWYEEQQVGIGDSFLVAHGETLRRIERSPETFAQVTNRVRRAMMRRFPFGVFFRLESDRIVVIAVLHASRDPDTWKSRFT